MISRDASRSGEHIRKDVCAVISLAMRSVLWKIYMVKPLVFIMCKWRNDKWVNHHSLNLSDIRINYMPFEANNISE